MKKLKVLDLFSGIGGFSLGLERTGGFETVAFCEIEAYPRRVLARHWPQVPCYDDVRTLTADTLRRDGIGVDVICGGFPCTDLSRAGLGAGLAGEKSGLWREFARLIGELRPRFVVVENVAELLGRGMGEVLGDLAELRYDAQWENIPACSVGYPHRRARIWIVAYPDGVRELQPGWGLSYERGWFGDEGEAVDWVLSRGGVLRSHDGISAGLDRIAVCSNGVVLAIPELIGRAILQAEGLTP